MREISSRSVPETPSKPGRIYLILLVIYLGFVIYGSLVPLEFRDVPFEQAIEKFRDIPYLQLGIQSRSDLVANFLLFIPLTFLAMGALTRENRRRAKLLIALSVAVTMALLSTAIEFAQIYFIPRTVSQNDILAETIGGFTGIVLWFCFGGRITRWARSLREEQENGRIIVKILGGYAVLMVLYQLFPFDLILNSTELSGKLKSSSVSLSLFDNPIGAVACLTKIGMMIPIGFLLVVHRSKRRWRVFRAVIWTLLLAVLIESAQLFVYSRCSSSTDVVLGTFGGLLGASGAMLFGPVARRPILETALWKRFGVLIKLPTTVAWVWMIAREKWWPFDFVKPDGGFAKSAKEMLVVPFARQYFTSEFNMVGQAVREFTAFFVLGMLLGSLSVPTGKVGKVVCVLTVVVFIVAFEIVQVFLPSRTADLTSMLIGAAGGVMGVCLFERFATVFLKASHGDISKTQNGEQ